MVKADISIGVRCLFIGKALLWGRGGQTWVSRYSKVSPRLFVANESLDKWLPTAEVTCGDSVFQASLEHRSTSYSETLIRRRAKELAKYDFFFNMLYCFRGEEYSSLYRICTLLLIWPVKPLVLYYWFRWILSLMQPGEPLIHWIFMMLKRFELTGPHQNLSL